MSKNSQLPTQKGTGPRFEQVLQAPTKVVVTGTGDDPALNDAALAHFGGPLRQFHVKQQQAYALSDNQIHKGYADLGGAQAMYTNIQGQEILHLDVHPETVKRLRKEGEQPLEYWPWAIIELEVPFVAGDDINIIIAAFLTSTVNHAVVWARDTYDENSADNILQFADTQAQFVDTRNPSIKIMNPDTGVFSPILRSSLLVDLRKLIPNQVVGIDLYGLRDTSDLAATTSTAVQATMNVALFESKPVDAVSIQSGFDTFTSVDDDVFYQWESSRLYPGRVKMGVVPGTVTIQPGIDTGSEDLPSFFGYPKIGTVKLGISSSNTGFNFKAA